jgi:hypothetical protein
LHPGDITCLKLYHENIPGSAAIRSALHDYDLGVCSSVPAASNQSSAQIINAVAKACKINPRVLLVTLQKEQGLVQDDDPTTYRYKAAMGYGCPDSAPQICGTDSLSTSRLFWQLYRAAWQFRWYGDSRGSFNYLKLGRKIKMAYSPKASCGKASFTLKSLATAKLYYYTPFTPNDKALAAKAGVEVKCGAYGNRNFWRWYWKWFGSPIAGGFLLKSATSATYLVVGDKKYRLASEDLANDYLTLGPVGVITDDYLNSFTSGGDLGRLVKNSAGTYYFVDSGKLSQFSSCAQATDFGFNCANAVTLTGDQLNTFSAGPNMGFVVPEDPAASPAHLFQISGGVKHEILDTAAATAAGINTSSVTQIPIDSFSYLPWGAPIARSNVLITNRTDNTHAILHAGKIYSIEKAAEAGVPFSNWFPFTGGSLSSVGISGVQDANLVRDIVHDPAGNYFLLTAAGKRAISTPTDVVTSAPVLPITLLNLIPTVGTALQTPALMQVSGSSDIFMIDNAVKRNTTSSEVRTRLAPVLASTIVQPITTGALAQITAASPLLSPGRMYIDKAKKLWLIDGLARKIRVPNKAQAALYGLGKGTKASATQLAGYSASGDLGGLKILCGSQSYLALSSKLQPIAPQFVSAYPGGSVSLNEITCNYLPKGTTQLGRFVKTPAGFIYLIEKGKRRLIQGNSTQASKQYLKLMGTTPAVFKVDQTFADLLPLGKKYPKTSVTPIDGTTPPAPAPTLTPTPTPTTNPAPASASPCPASYAKFSGNYWVRTVKSGDSLGAIAKKCKTTVSQLITWNKRKFKKVANGINVGWSLRVSKN